MLGVIAPIIIACEVDSLEMLAAISILDAVVEVIASMIIDCEVDTLEMPNFIMVICQHCCNYVEFSNQYIII